MEQLDAKTEAEIKELYEGNQSSYLVFSIKEHRYAFKSSLIQEIVYGSKVHVIPFAPNYIEGVLNCRGNPYSVINVLKMNNEENSDLNEKVFLLFLNPGLHKNVIDRFYSGFKIRVFHADDDVQLR